MPRRSTTNASAEQARNPRKGEHERFISAWLDQVRRDPELLGSAFKVAYEIAIHLNRKTREAWPSQDTIGTKTALSEATVKRLIGELRARGHLHVDHPNNQGRGKATHYRLVIKPERGSNVNPFNAVERGSSKTEKGVHPCTKRGSPANPDLMKTLGEAKASPQGERETCADAHNDPTLVAAAPNGAATEEEDDASEKEEASFSELRRVWKRPWVDTNDADAMKLYLDAIRQTSPEAILTAAKAWVEAADAPRFLPPLSKWLGCRGWEKDPPKKPAKAPRQQQGQRRGKADLGRMMLALGEDYSASRS